MSFVTLCSRKVIQFERKVVKGKEHPAVNYCEGYRGQYVAAQIAIYTTTAVLWKFSA